ncbi:MAG: hypothetical protein NTW03_02090 [Verrucomicrobia bacterium]|nr:hypothetical protein [Verrucomicrobiota bacterium]
MKYISEKLWIFGLGLLAAGPLPAADWQLAWSDEFNGQGLPHSTNWIYD